MSVVVHCGEKQDGNASGAFSALDPLGSYSRARPWDWLSSSSVRRLAWIVLMATPIVATSRSRNVRCRGENE